jgi:selenocysteine lyase/cysteine desulfurase
MQSVYTDCISNHESNRRLYAKCNPSRNYCSAIIRYRTHPAGVPDSQRIDLPECRHVRVDANDETRKHIAALIHAAPEEIAFTRNATDGINLVLAGLDWKPGDEVITTKEEHEAIQHPLLYLQKMKGIKFNMVEVSPQPEVMLERLEQVYTARTRLLAMSYITCETGTRLPAPALSQWAAEHHVLCLLDGAQASGALSVDVGELGCDFYASNGPRAR